MSAVAMAMAMAMATTTAVAGDFVVRAVEGVAPWVWRASWQGAVLAVAVAVVLKVVGRRLSPGWRFGLWGLVLVRLAVPPVVAVSWWGTGERVAVGVPVVSHDTRPASPTFNGERRKAIEIRPSPLPSPTAGAPAREGARVALGDAEAATAGVALSSSSVRGGGASWGWARTRAVAIWVWVAGVVFLAVRVLVSSVRLSRAVRRCAVVVDPRVSGVVRDCCAELGVRRAPGVRVLAAGGGPALVGFWRPVILLPPGVMAGMSDDELRLIVLHELAHVRRRDVLVNWLATAVAVLHWANPVVWLVMARMRFERELACDEVVMRAGRGTAGGGGGGGDRRAYARTIVRLAEALSVGGGGGRVAMPAGAVGIIEGKTQLQRRLQMIARFDATTAAGRRWPVVATGLGLLVGAVALSGATRAAAPPAPADKPVEKKTTAVAAEPGGEGAKPPAAPVDPRTGAAGKASLSAEAKRVLAELLDRPAPPSDAELEAAKQSLWKQYAKKQVVVAGEVTNTNDLVAGYNADVAGIGRGVAEAKERRWAAGGKQSAAGGAAGSAGATGGAADPASAKAAEKLKKPMQVQFNGQGLSDTLDFLRDATGVDILVQWNQLEAAGMTKDQPVTISLREPTPAEAVLSLMFRTLPVRLKYEIDHGVVVIGTVDDVTVAAAAPEVTKVYDVSDLVGGRAGGAGGAEGGAAGGGPGGFAPPGAVVGGPGVPGGFGGGMPGGAMVAGDDVTQLMRLIMTTVQPESWRDAGGPSGSITSFKGKLVIKATEAAHKEVGQLLEMLREGPKKGK